MSTTQFAPGRFTLDPTRSFVRFRHKANWGFATVQGGFGSVSGDGEVTADGSGHGTITVDAASLDTKNPKRDTHLRSKAFFDVEEFPEITFDATLIKPTGAGIQVEGELTVRGTSRKLSFPGTYETEGTDAVVLRCTAEIQRTDFGMTWNKLGMIKGSAAVELELRFTTVVRQSEIVI